MLVGVLAVVGSELQWKQPLLVTICPSSLTQVTFYYLITKLGSDILITTSCLNELKSNLNKMANVWKNVHVSPIVQRFIASSCTESYNAVRILQ